MNQKLSLDNRFKSSEQMELANEVMSLILYSKINPPEN